MLLAGLMCAHRLGGAPGRTGCCRSRTPVRSGLHRRLGWLALAELGERLLRGREDREDGQELGDGEQVGDLLRDTDEPEPPALLTDSRVRPDHLAETRRIHVGDLGHIEQDASLSLLLDQTKHRIAEEIVALADEYLPVEVNDRQVSDLADHYLHIPSSCLCRRYRTTAHTE